MENLPTIDTAVAAEQGGATAGVRRAVVLLSGGLDSATAAAWARGQGYALTALSVAYGQRHAIELTAAREVAAALGIGDHVELAVDLAAFGGSVLVDPAAVVPKGRSDAEIAHGIPATYVPARNTVFLSLALALAETRGAAAIVLGVNAIDYSGYPDCRPEYLAAFERLAALATKAGVEGNGPRILAPLVSLSKAEIIRLGHSLGVAYGLTTSCYDPLPGGRPCGACDSCRLRAAGFAAAGLVDPRVERSAP
jgi:7-cyano-7-deazaguanine synthase